MLLRHARRKEAFSLHWLRWLGLLGILSVFFLGGVLVSLKIGGGGDLHNMDGFLVFWVLIIGSLLAGAYAPENKQDLPKPAPSAAGIWLVLAAVVPLYFALSHAASLNFQPAAAQRAELARMQAALDLVDGQAGDVLFISERQLLSFKALQGVQVVPEYEKVFLMEMAMGNNQPYLESFYADLEKSPLQSHYHRHDFHAHARGQQILWRCKTTPGSQRFWSRCCGNITGPELESRKRAPADTSWSATTER